MEEVKQVDTVETEKIEETVEEKKEDRAYIGYIYDNRDFLNNVMNIMADATSILQWAKNGEDRISESDSQILKDCIKACANILADANEARSVETEKEKEEVVEEVEERAETTIEEDGVKIVEEETKDEETVEGKEETEERSIDLTEYYNILDRL